jgi:hypothetical protein
LLIPGALFAGPSIFGGRSGGHRYSAAALQR